MKKILLALLVAMSTSWALAAETIKLYWPYNPGFSSNPALFKLIERANASQSIYKFQLEFRPGGNGSVAVQAMDANPETSLAFIAASFVDHIKTGKLIEQDYVPVHAIGTICFAVITNKPLAGAKEFVAGGAGLGNSTHLTALALGEKYGFDVRYIVFRSGNEALINMAGNNGVEFAFDKYETYQALKTKNPNLRMVAASCPTRLPQEPGIKTLAEQGIQVPPASTLAVAHRLMPQARRVAIANILDTATKDIGAREFFELSALRPPVFDGIGPEEYYRNLVQGIRKLQDKYQSKIDSQRQ